MEITFSGLWELFVKGDAFQRGEAIGQLSSDLLHHQEKVFVDQIREIVPSDSYLKFLRFFIVLFNRNLGENVLEEYRDEIYGISLSCTHKYDFIGTPYERQLNYHSAHDLGHAMQDYMLVGCREQAGGFLCTGARIQVCFCGMAGYDRSVIRHERDRSYRDN